jgi:succinate dehydrogenase/fumarate reductase-like Fe-S protein
MVEEKRETITVQVRRGTKEKNQLVSYEVPYESGQSVLGVLQFIREQLEPNLGFTSSCRIGLCTSCLVRVNGKVVRSCTTLVEGDMIVEPYKESLVIRDLIAELPQLTRESRNVERGLPV